MSSDSTELYYAEMEAARNQAETAYFDARPWRDREGVPVETFRAGFERAFARLWNQLQDLKAASTQETPAVPSGHFWAGARKRTECRNCGQDYAKHLHTDEASMCPTANR